MEAWRVAHRLVLMIYEATSNFPDEERFGLTNQIRRAVISVTSNIAEGFSRKTAKEKRKFYNIAQGSLIELQNQLIASRDIGYLPKLQFAKIADQTIIAHKLICGLTRSAK